MQLWSFSKKKKTCLKYEKEQVSSTLHAWSVVGQSSGPVAAGESRDSTLDLDSTSSTTSAIHSSPQCSAVQQRLTVWFIKTISKIVCSYTSLSLSCLRCFIWREDCCAVNVKWSVVMQIMHWLSRSKTARRISDTIYNSYNSHTHNLQSTILFPNVNSLLKSPTFSWKESCSEPLNTFSMPQTESIFLVLDIYLWLEKSVATNQILSVIQRLSHGSDSSWVWSLHCNWWRLSNIICMHYTIWDIHTKCKMQNSICPDEIANYLCNCIGLAANQAAPGMHGRFLVVGFPNWHVSGCHFQEQVGWGSWQIFSCWIIMDMVNRFVFGSHNARGKGWPRPNAKFLMWSKKFSFSVDLIMVRCSVPIQWLSYYTPSPQQCNVASL